MQWKHRGEDSELICMGHPIKLIDVKQILFLPILLAESMLQVLLLLYIFFIKRLKIGPHFEISWRCIQSLLLVREKKVKMEKFPREFGLL